MVAKSASWLSNWISDNHQIIDLTVRSASPGACRSHFAGVMEFLIFNRY